MTSTESESGSIINGMLTSIFWLPVLYVAMSFGKWLLNYISLIRKSSALPGVPFYPFLGNLLDVSLDRDKVLGSFVDLTRKFKNESFYRFWSGTYLQVIFHKADNLEFVLSNSKNSEKSFEYRFLHPWLKFGLITSGGDKWFQRRRMITPTFHFEILNDFLQIMNEQSEILVDVLTKLHRENKEIDIFHRIGLCALDIICETAMGQNVDAQRQDESEYVKAVKEISHRIYERTNKPYFWWDSLYALTPDSRSHNRCLKILHSFTRKVIQERSQEFEQSNFGSKKRIAFMDMLLKARAEDSSLTCDDIQEEVDTFMFAGHDTTTSGAAWICQMIGAHPEVQQKLHEEIDRVFGSSERHITNEDLGNLKYLECVVKETLRLFPPVPLYIRTVTEDQMLEGKLIPKGAALKVFPYMIHRDEKNFPDPERFDPDRFLPENSADRHPFAYVPFSAGKRNCVGQRFAMMEEKVLIANILRRFEIKALRETKDIVQLPELILKPKGGVLISLKPRSFQS